MSGPWDVLASRTVVDDPWLRLAAQRVRLPTGAILDPFYLIDERSWACCVAALPDGRITLVEQYRHGAGMATWELPAGDIDAGEDPASAAVRELREETGYRAAAAPIALGRLYPEPSRNRSCGHGFVISVAAEPGPTAHDAGEAIRVRVTSAREALMDPRFCHAVQVAFLRQAIAEGHVSATV